MRRILVAARIQRSQCDPGRRERRGDDRGDDRSDHRADHGAHRGSEREPDLLRGGKGSAYKVTYNFAMSGGTTTQDQTGSLTQTVKVPLFRQDLTLTVGGKTQTITTIINGQGTFSCGSFISGTPGCFNFGGATGAAIGAAATAPQGPTGVPSDLAGWNLVPASSKNVAGQDTRCFSFTGPTATTGAAAGVSVTATGCYTSQGVPLYIASKVGSITSEMTATQFSTSVTDADFALPYPVTQIPGFPAPSKP